MPPPQPPPDLPLPTEAPVRSERYMHWTLLADLAATVPLVLWIVEPEDLYLPVPALTLVPLIHAAHGQTENAGISLLMRTAMVGGVYLASQSAQRECPDDGDLCVPIGSIMLGNAAIVTVVVLDSLLLAKRDVADSDWKRLPLVPGVATGPGGRVTFSIGSQF
jgi:hypothetical protein